jgi:hypothetical protein
MSSLDIIETKLDLVRYALNGRSFSALKKIASELFVHDVDGVTRITVDYKILTKVKREELSIFLSENTLTFALISEVMYFLDIVESTCEILKTTIADIDAIKRVQRDAENAYDDFIVPDIDAKNIGTIYSRDYNIETKTLMVLYYIAKYLEDIFANDFLGVEINE